MDIRRLVGHVADALGPDASEERVEKIAAAILDAEHKDHAQTNRVIITAYGYDQPGILAALTKAIYDSGCNITDVTQKILGPYCTMIMVADLSAAKHSLAELQSALALAGQEVGIRVVAQHEELFASIHRP